MEDNAPHRPQDREPGLDAPAGRAADERHDPELDELAALEMQVDNWLSPPARAETVAPEPREPVEEPRPQPELRQRSEAPQASGEPPFTPAGMPRGLKRALLAVLGLGAVGAAIGAAMFLNQPGQPDRAPEPVAGSARTIAVAPVTLPARPDPAPLVFLDEDEGGRAAAAAAPPAAPSAEGGKAGVGAPETVAPKQAVVRKKKETVVAKRTPERRSRRLTDAERVEAAVAECRATSTRPGGCNIRVCDVLGSAHPACRE